MLLGRKAINKQTTILPRERKIWGSNTDMPSRTIIISNSTHFGSLTGSRSQSVVLVTVEIWLTIAQMFVQIDYYFRPFSCKNCAFSLQGLEGCLLLACLTSQQHASVSQGRICSDNFTCCHTEIEVADQTFYLTQSQYTDTGPTSPSADPVMPGAWQGSHWSGNF